MRSRLSTSLIMSSRRSAETRAHVCSNAIRPRSAHRNCWRCSRARAPRSASRREGYRMWGLIPAAGRGSRIQPLAFSKELLPVGSRLDHGVERPRAVSEYLIERMLLAGTDKICFVIGPGKSDILEYYGGAETISAHVSFVIQRTPAGLCDAIFQTAPLIDAEETVLIGLPDTIWFPRDGFAKLFGDFSFLLFP